MSMDLRILGIRKLCWAETAALAGKPSGEILASRFFRTLYPSAPARSGYQLFPKYTDDLRSIRRMITPIVTEEDDVECDEVSYIYWEEELGSYWRSLIHEEPLIDEILEAARGRMRYDQAYSPVPYALVDRYCNRNRPTCPEDEIFAISYG